ncbi:hypothetical protein ACQP1K_21065 [Sphaerimonospora sp. CA-214678]|uniref:hypothetical protein n=1 Tax=Sphaerimonospora sp. CA-214678 TaxID=3240029 RepID=UPI003D950720
MFAKVFAGLALGAALAGGIVTLGATAAGATTGPNNNNNNNHLLNNNDQLWNTNAWYNPQFNWWGQQARADNRNGRENLGMAVKDVVLGFQEKSNRDDKQFLNNWLNNHSMFGGQGWLNNNQNLNERPLQQNNRRAVQPVLVQPLQRTVRQPVVRERLIQPIQVQPVQRVVQPIRRFDDGLGRF